MKELHEEESVEKDIESKTNNPESHQLSFTIKDELEVTSIDHIYDEVGYNIITIKNIFLTSLVLSIEGLHFTLFSLMIIPLKEFFKMTEEEIKVTSSMIFIFVGVGSLLSGRLAGKFGRPLIINFLLFMVTLLNIGLAYTKIWWAFMIIRCVIGLLLGITIPMSLNLLTEYLPLKLRSFVLTSIWGGFTIGSLVLLNIMLYVMPNMESIKVKNTILLCAILPFVAFIFNFALLRDSPRNLIIRNKEKEGFEILEKIYDRKIEEKTKIKILKESHQSFQDLSFDIKEMFNMKFGKISLILIYVWFLNSMVVYGTSVTSNLTMQAIGKQDNSTNLDIIRNQIFINFINLLFLFIGGLMTETACLGRKLSTNINQILALVFVILPIFWPENFPLFFALFSSLQGIAFSIITTYSCEVYPTKIRDHAIGLLFCSTRIGGFLSQILYLYFHSLGIWIPYYATAIFNAICIILVFLLPYDSYGLALDKEVTHKS